MSKSKYELDPERLATTDERGNRIYLYPEDVQGRWKERRKYVYWGLILLYLVLPWFMVNGKPALLVNIFQREFTVLGFTLHGMEPLVFFTLLASGLFAFAFLTSYLGRVWCGWACPQTVFIQAIFLTIERWVEGKARQREALNAAPWSAEKLFKRTLKWGLYLLVSLHIAHTFIGYFVGPRTLFEITLHSPFENWGLFTATMLVTAIVLLDFGWFREQFCLIACPYGRIQSVMMDENSLVVAYDAKRGEPRKGLSAAGEGDCVNCYNCVKVCPTGIDIRRGTQLECIACTQCIDACDDIMRRLKKPEGLIRYASERELQGLPRKRFTKRMGVYLTICTVLLVGFVMILRHSTKPNVLFLRAKGAPFEVLANPDGQLLVRNTFQVVLRHQGGQSYELDLRVADERLRQRILLTQPIRPWRLSEAEVKQVLIVRFPEDLLRSGESGDLLIDFVDHASGQVVLQRELKLVGPL